MTTPHPPTPPVTKAVVLARGLGTRMRRDLPNVALSATQAAMADRGAKAMIAVAGGRPFLDYLIASLADAGLTRIGIVIGPEHDFIPRRYLSEAVPTRVQLSFPIQEEPLGTADAVRAAEAFVAGDPFLMVNADNLYPVAALRALIELPGPGLIGFEREALIRASNIPADRIARFALIWTDERGCLTKIVEKPDPEAVQPTALVSMNSWRFSPRIFEACAAISRSARGELELQDAAQYAIDRLGETFQVVPWRGGVLDLSGRGDIAAVTERLRDVEVVL